MSPQRWRNVRDIFDSALEQPESEQDEFARQACGNDAELYRQVRGMLERHRATAFIDRPASAPPPEPPVFHNAETVAERYFILRYISCGGMGEVYEARDLELGMSETVALKTLLPAIADDESMIARFKQEIALSRRVAHPNVCKVFDLARHQGEDGRSVIFLTMEFLAGETLAERLRREGAMSEAAALSLLEQMGAALDASHAAGVIHRDFKPSNVMLVPAGDGTRVVVTDFGLARRSVVPEGSTASMSKAVVGTLDYMAPELLTGGVATFASDVYALGMVAYRMVTGALPFAGEGAMAAAIRRSREPVPSPRLLAPGLDEKWERAILRALDRNPAKRFSQARHFLQALRGDPVSMTLKLPVVTRRRAAVAMLVAALALGAAAGWREWRKAKLRLPLEAQVLYQKGVDDIAAGAYFAATQALQEALKYAPASPQLHARLAEALVELEQPERAGEQMLTVTREDTSDLSKIDRLRIDAIVLEITRDFAAAAAKYEEMARIGGGNANVTTDLARAYEHAGKTDDAIRQYRSAAEGPGHNPAAWLRLGVLYAQRSNKSKSDEAFGQAERLYGLTSNLEGLTEVSLQEGIAANTRGDLEAAAAFLQKALATAKVAGNLQQEINATLRLSTNAYLSGDTAAAEGYAREALDSARRHQLGAMAIRGLSVLGSAYQRKQDFAHAEQYWNEALDLARQTGSIQLKASALLRLAGLHDQTKDRKRAVAEAQEALVFYHANHYAKESLQCLTVITRAQRDSGDYEGALASFRSMLQAAEKLQDRYQIALAHENIGTLLFELDRFPEALDHYRKSHEMAANTEQAGYASLQCGNTLWRLGRYSDAAGMFLEIDSIAKKFPDLAIEAMYGRAGMLLSQNKFPEAADLARAALAANAGRRPDVDAGAERVLGLALLGTGNKPEGLGKCEAARAAAESRHDMTDILLARVAVLQARIELGERKQALELLQETEPRLAQHPELLWRALALTANVNAQYLGRARDALKKISVLWGDSAYNNYLTRPDIQKLSRPLL
jgi:tetratricopeptide (TPR) repeat protein